MKTPSKTRVLVIDDDDQVRSDLTAILEHRGYQVQAPEAAGKALYDRVIAVEKEFRPHIDIVDLRLMEEYLDDQSGMLLLKEMSAPRRILYSSHLDTAVIRAATQRFGASDCIGKDEHPDILLDAVERVASEVCAEQRGMTINLPPGDCSLQHILGLLLPKVNIPPEMTGMVHDVIAMLFPGSVFIHATRIPVSVNTTQSSGHPRSFVLKALYDDKIEPQIIKLAPCGDTKIEVSNYQEFIKDNLAGGFYPNLEKHSCFYELGGLRYRFIGNVKEDILTFYDFYDGQDDGKTLFKPLRHLLGEAWSLLYAKKDRDKDKEYASLSLYEQYNQSLKLDSKLDACPEQTDTFTLTSGDLQLPNPVAWLKKQKNGSLLGEIRGSGAITHGDLHLENILTDGEHAWTIDFERSGWGPRLRDFTELAADIVVRKVELDDEKAYLAVAADLVGGLVNPGYHQGSIPPSGAEVKAVKVVFQLKALAAEVTSFKDDREFLLGLLCQAVKDVYRYQKNQNHMHYRKALILGAAIAAWLGGSPKTRKEWPLKDWKTQQPKPEKSGRGKGKVITR